MRGLYRCTNCPEQNASLHHRRPDQEDPPGWSRRQDDTPNTHWPEAEFAGTIESLQEFDCSKHDDPPPACCKRHVQVHFFSQGTVVRAHSLKLDLNSTARTKIGPNCIYLRTALIHLVHFRPTENRNP